LAHSAVFLECIGGLSEMSLEVLPGFIDIRLTRPLLAGVVIHLGKLDEIESVGQDLVFIVGCIGVGG
jgi:hypothetical protein